MSRTRNRKRKRQKRSTWGVSRVTDPRYPWLNMRITELEPGGMLYAIRMVDGKQKMATCKMRRADLGTTEKEQGAKARALALDLIAELAVRDGSPADVGPKPRAASKPVAVLTWAALAEEYEVRGFAGRGTSYKKQSVASIRRIGKFLGADTVVAAALESDWQRYHASRAKFRAAARSDLVAAKIACAWAVKNKLLAKDDDPWKDLRLSAITGKHTPKRPVATIERFHTIRRASRLLPETFGPRFSLIFRIVGHTGRRIDEVLTLRWQDVDLSGRPRARYGTIRWRAGRVENRKGRDRVVPMNKVTRAALLRLRKISPGIGEALLFGKDSDNGKPLDRHLPTVWLRKAEKAAGVEHIRGGSWHMYRRMWASERKDLSPVDVAEAGGWLDTATMFRSYQQPDPQTIESVINYRKVGRR
jgi:integrase